VSAPKTPPAWVTSLSAEQRIEKASTIIDKLVGHTQEVIALHESNRILVYSDKLSGQVGRSYAANAFAALQRSQHLYEIVRLLALWDKPSEHRESIPTALLLLNSAEIQRTLVEKVRASWPPPDRFGDTMAERARKRLNIVQVAGARIAASEHLTALRRLRNESLAHNLNIPKDPTTPGRPPKYGDERWLLSRSWRMLECLNTSVRQTSFAWTGTIGISRRYAEAFWHGVTIKVLR
jgi:hypothetical protein